MTPDDLAALLRWLYANDDGSGWLPAAARALRLNERNLRGMLAGKVAIPPAIAAVVAILVAALAQLRGRHRLTGQVERTTLADQLADLPLSNDAAALLAHWRQVVDLGRVA